MGSVAKDTCLHGAGQWRSTEKWPRVREPGTSHHEEEEQRLIFSGGILNILEVQALPIVLGSGPVRQRGGLLGT